MSTTYIPVAIRRRVSEAAKFRCGYCLTQEVIIGMPLEIEHIIPEAQNGSSEEENLWLGCPSCNHHKSDTIEVLDEATNTIVPLFNPRLDVWNEHFYWEEDGLFVRGSTPTGRVTVVALQLNNPFVVRARRIWIAVGLHPPYD